MAWLSGWSRRKKVTVTGTTAGAQTDFQLMLDVTYDSDMLANFDDLRFTLADGTTLIDFWLESKVDSTSAVVWAEVPSIPANPDTIDIYMYYGKADAASASNGEATFEFFDDFDRADSPSLGAKWTEYGDGLYAISSNTVSRPDATSVDVVEMALATGLGQKSDIIVTSKIKVTTISGTDGYLGIVARANTATGTTHRGYALNWRTAITTLQQLDARVAWLTSKTVSAHALNEWWWSELTVEGNNIKSKVWKVGTAKPISYDIIDTRTTVASGYVGLYTYGYSDYVASGYFDDFFVRKYASPEPTYGTGSEENAGYWFRLQARNELQGMRGING